MIEWTIGMRVGIAEPRSELFRFEDGISDVSY
jgi:hypothetical protein